MRTLTSSNPSFSTTNNDGINPIPIEAVSFENVGFSDAFYDGAKFYLSRWGLTRIAFDFVTDPELKGRYNMFIVTCVQELLRYASLQREITLRLDEHPNLTVLHAIIRRYWSTLVGQARISNADPAGLVRDRARRTANKAQQRVSIYPLIPLLLVTPTEVCSLQTAYR